MAEFVYSLLHFSLAIACCWRSHVAGDRNARSGALLGISGEGLAMLDRQALMAPLAKGAFS
ncbi:MAG: hypothetical protein AAFY15_02450 [Cyanobacteria bacterium J06648_11]